MAFDAASDGLWDIDIAEDDVYLSPRYLSILGYSESESGRTLPTIGDLCRPGERDRIRSAWRAHVEDGVPFDVEVELRCGNGQWRWIHARGKIVIAMDDA